MANCMLCETQLKSLNTPFLGNKTKDGVKALCQMFKKFRIKK